MQSRAQVLVSRQGPTCYVLVRGWFSDITLDLDPARPSVEPASPGPLRLTVDAGGVTASAAPITHSRRRRTTLGLQRGDVDWNRAVLTIRRSRTRPRCTHGCDPSCGRKCAGHRPDRVDDRPTTDTTKSRAGPRVVPLPAAILELLRTHVSDQAQERERAAQLWLDEGWVFATKRVASRACPEDSATRAAPPTPSARQALARQCPARGSD